MQQWFSPGRGVLSIKAAVMKKTLSAFLIITFAIINLFMLLILIVKTERLEKLIPKMSDNITMEEAFIKTTDEINLLREMLDLPPTEIVSFVEEDKRNGDSEKVTGYEIYYSAFDTLYYGYKSARDKKELNLFLEKTKGITADYLLVSEQRESLSVLMLNDRDYYSIKAGEDNGTYMLSPFPFEKEYRLKTDNDFKKILENTFDNVKLIYDNADSDINKLKDYFNPAMLKRTALEKKIIIKPAMPAEQKDAFIINLYDIKGADNKTTLGTISYSYKTRGIMLNENIYTDFNQFKNAFINVENIVDIRTREEKILQNSFNDINQMIKDQSFKMFLENRGYYLSGETRQDNDYVYYDIMPLDKTQTRIGSYAVNKHTGYIYIIDFEEVIVSSFKSFVMNNINGNQAVVDLIKKKI